MITIRSKLITGLNAVETMIAYQHIAWGSKVLDKQVCVLNSNGKLSILCKINLPNDTILYASTNPTIYATLSSAMSAKVRALSVHVNLQTILIKSLYCLASES